MSFLNLSSYTASTEQGKCNLLLHYKFQHGIHLVEVENFKKFLYGGEISEAKAKQLLDNADSLTLEQNLLAFKNVTGASLPYAENFLALKKVAEAGKFQSYELFIQMALCSKKQQYGFTTEGEHGKLVISTVRNLPTQIYRVY